MAYTHFMKFSDGLEKIMAEMGWSKNALAAALQMEQPAVRRYFRDGYEPKLSTLKSIADKLGISVGYLVGEREIKGFKKKNRI